MPDVTIQLCLSQNASQSDHTVANRGGTSLPDLPRGDLSRDARSVPERPPAGFAAYDPDLPETDFQLQQAERLVRAMATTATIRIRAR